MPALTRSSRPLSRTTSRCRSNSSGRIGSVGGSSNRLLRDRNGRLAYADGRNDGGEQAKYGERVEPAAKAAGGIFEPADDRGLALPPKMPTELTQAMPLAKAGPVRNTAGSGNI